MRSSPNNLPVFHDEANPLESRDVSSRVAVDGNQIGNEPRRHASNRLFDVQDLRGT